MSSEARRSCCALRCSLPPHPQASIRSLPCPVHLHETRSRRFTGENHGLLVGISSWMPFDQAFILRVPPLIRIHVLYETNHQTRYRQSVLTSQSSHSLVSIRWPCHKCNSIKSGPRKQLLHHRQTFFNPRPCASQGGPGHRHILIWPGRLVPLPPWPPTNL
jgi:hypothetical protein